MRCVCWCPGEDSNPHGVTRQYLKLVRLPIPPPGHILFPMQPPFGPAKYLMFLYIIGTQGRRQKIGFSKDVSKRLATLQTGNPEPLTIHHVEEVPDHRARLLEKKIHRDMNYKRIKGEWFDMTPEEAKSMLQFVVIRYMDDLNI